MMRATLIGLLAAAASTQFPASFASRTDSVSLGDDGTLPLVMPTTTIVENGEAVTKFPLVVFLHGFCLDPVRQETNMVGFSQMVDSEQFVLALPTGPSNGGGVMLPFCSAYDGTDGSRFMLPLFMTRPKGDVPFLKHVLKRSIDHMKREGKPVDPSRIYAVGLANGAFMAHRLACELPDVFAGVIAYTGATGAKDTNSTCFSNWEELGGTNVLQIHGDRDAWVPYEGGINWPGSLESTEIVAEGMGCDMNAAEVVQNAFEISAGSAVHNVTTTTYDDCSPGASSVEWRVHGLDHLPAGGSGLKPVLKKGLRWLFEHSHPNATSETLSAALADAAPGNGGTANAPQAAPVTLGVGAGSSAGGLARFIGGRGTMLTEFAGAAIGETGRSSRVAATASRLAG